MEDQTLHQLPATSLTMATAKPSVHGTIPSTTTLPPINITRTMLKKGFIVRVRDQRKNNITSDGQTGLGSAAPVYRLFNKIADGKATVWQAVRVELKGEVWIKVQDWPSVAFKLQDEDQANSACKEFEYLTEAYGKICREERRVCCILPSQVGTLELGTNQGWMSAKAVAMISPYHTSLIEFLDRNLNNPYRTALVLVKAALALECIHRQSLVVMDVKTTNILVEEIKCSDGSVEARPLLIDFGEMARKKKGPLWWVAGTSGFHSLSSLALKFFGFYEGEQSNMYDEAWRAGIEEDSDHGQILDDFRDLAAQGYTVSNDLWAMGIVMLEALSDCKQALFGGTGVTFPNRHFDREITQYFNDKDKSTSYSELRKILESIADEYEGLWDPVRLIYTKELGFDFNHCFLTLRYLLQPAKRNRFAASQISKISRGTLLEVLQADLEDRIKRSPVYVRRPLTKSEQGKMQHVPGVKGFHSIPSSSPSTARFISKSSPATSAQGRNYYRSSPALSPALQSHSTMALPPLPPSIPSSPSLSVRNTSTSLVSETSSSSSTRGKARRSWMAGVGEFIRETPERNFIVIQRNNKPNFEVFARMNNEKTKVVIKPWKNGEACGKVYYICGLCYDPSNRDPSCNLSSEHLLSHWEKKCPGTLNNDGSHTPPQCEILVEPK